MPARAQFRPAQAPKGTESTSRTDVFHLILVCAREERAKPIGDRRGGRWSPCGAGAEAGRGLRPRGFSVGPEQATSEPEAGVAARLMTEPWEARAPCASGTRLARAEQALGPKGWLEDASPETMRRDGRSSGAMIFRKPEP